MKKKTNKQIQLEERLSAARKRRRRSVIRAIIAAVIGLLAIGFIFLIVINQPKPATNIPTPTVLGLEKSATGAPVDGISCGSTEQLKVHIHAHLTIYINGQNVVVPAGIGITPPRQAVSSRAGPVILSGTCFYWLHSHQEDGIVHIESPGAAHFTLGQYFDIWGQKLSSSQIGSNTGKLYVYIDGKVYNGNPQDIPLTAHESIQLNLGSNMPFVPFTFPQGL